jgi:hypothetical protein
VPKFNDLVPASIRIECGEYPGTLREILSVPQNIVMDSNNIIYINLKRYNWDEPAINLHKELCVFFISPCTMDAQNVYKSSRLFTYCPRKYHLPTRRRL